MEVNEANTVFDGEKDSILGSTFDDDMNDLGLKCCIVERKCKNKVSGSNVSGRIWLASGNF